MTFTLEIIQDTDAVSPREDDNLGVMCCYHNRYDLGDKDATPRLDWRDYSSWDELRDALYKAVAARGDKIVVCLPLYLYDHSGITMRTHPFGCSWDSGQVGYIYTTRKRLQAAGFDWQCITKGRRLQIGSILNGEVEEYDKYLTGDVWGYKITDDAGTVVDSCWGFIGHEYCEQEGNAALKYYQDHERAGSGEQLVLL
jgi:hypothetical protein